MNEFSMSNSDTSGPVGLPVPLVAFVEAANAGDAKALIDTFAENALVNDQLKEYWRKAAISKWITLDITGKRFAIQVLRAVVNHDQVVVTASVTGDFDMRGLPHPLILTFYFSLRAGQIVQLLILRNEPDE
jgi:hypothetical protein